MKILIVTDRFPVLSETFIVNKIVGLAERGNQLRVIARYKGDSNYYRDFFEYPIKSIKVRYLPPDSRLHWLQKILSLPWLCLLALWRDCVGLLRLLNFLKSRYGIDRTYLRLLFRLIPFVGEKPDIIHFEWSFIAAYYIGLLYLLPGKKVVSCRGADIDISPLMKPELASKLQEVFNKIDGIHCVSNAMVKSAERYGLDIHKSFVNYPSIDIKFFVPFTKRSSRKKNGCTIITVARLHWKKGYEYALLAIRLLLERGHSIRYLIVGDGNEKTHIKFSISDMGLTESVVLVGAQTKDEIRDLLNDSHIFLLPSVSEGLSNSVLEAMAMELPVVTTNAGGMSEAVNDGKEGFVVPERDYKTMAERLECLILKRELCYQMGKKGRERVVNHFNLDKQIELFNQYYENLILANNISDMLSY